MELSGRMVKDLNKLSIILHRTYSDLSVTTSEISHFDQMIGFLERLLFQKQVYYSHDQHAFHPSDKHSKEA